MGGYSTKRMMFLQILTPIMLLHLFISSSSGEAAVNSSENGVSEGSVPYELQRNLFNFADLEFKNLTMCSLFHDKTNCSASSASLTLQNLATHGEASKDCLSLFKLLECSICHPDVGTQPRICASFCDSVFEACSDAYFTTHDQVIVPCGASNASTICERASELESNGTSFCEAMGFKVVQTTDDSSEEPCYGSKTILVKMVPVLESLINIVRFQELKCKMLILSLALMWMTSLFALVNRRDVRR